MNGGEALVILLVAVLVIGPERLPAHAEQLGAWVRRLRVLLRDARQRVDDELGDAAEQVDWAALDPRRYDPRRIVRDALLEDVVPGATAPRAPATAAGWPAAPPAARTSPPGRAAAPRTLAAPGDVPFDDEAT